MLRVVVDWAASLFEAAGMLVMTLGAIVALALTLRDGRAGAFFKTFRYRLGRAIILGLELLVAADILRTISTEPTVRDVAVLGGIVLIRTFLSFSLEVELEGRWPWQAAAQARARESPRTGEPPKVHEPSRDRHPDEPSTGETTH